MRQEFDQKEDLDKDLAKQCRCHKYICRKKSIVLVLTDSDSYSSLGVWSNQKNVTCFDLLRSHQTRLLERHQEVKENF